jgi:hypothetical protein
MQLMESKFRWVPPRDFSIAFRLFKYHHTILNNMYWAHVPAHLTIQKICKEQSTKTQKPLDFFVNKDENDRRVKIRWEDWFEAYYQFLSMTRLNFLLDMNSYFEIYLISIYTLAMESRPDILIQRPCKVDGISLLKYGKNYRFHGQIDSNYMFANQLLTLTKGDWHKRVDGFINLFGDAPKELTNNIDKLDEIRKKRNSVGHDFARAQNASGKIQLILDDEAQGISEENLKKAWDTINDVAVAIDTFLMKNFIGAYEFVAFYKQHWGENVSKEAETLKGSEKIKINNFVANQADACRRLLGEDGYHPISKEYSTDLIHYFFFEI